MTPRRTPSLNRRTLSVALLVVALGLVAGCGSSSESSGVAEVTGPDELTVERVAMDWPANPETAAVYLTIRNPEATADALVGASTPIAREASIHRSTEDDQGRSIMNAVDRLEVPARSTMRFEPGSLHLMLEGITEDVTVGDEVPMTLTFERAGELEVTALVAMPGTAYADPDSASKPVHGH